MHRSGHIQLTLLWKYTLSRPPYTERYPQLTLFYVPSFTTIHQLPTFSYNMLPPKITKSCRASLFTLNFRVQSVSKNFLLFSYTSLYFPINSKNFLLYLNWTCNFPAVPSNSLWLPIRKSKKLQDYSPTLIFFKIPTKADKYLWKLAIP